MDYIYNSSDILFPEDTGIPKLTSPMYTKVPEGIDWASQDLMETFNDNSCQDLIHMLSPTRRMKISDNDDNDGDDEFNNLGPLKPSKQHSDEKKLCQALSSIYHPLDHKEVHEIIKDVFELVQKDIQKNNHGYPPYFAEPFLSWKDEIWEDGNAIGSIGDISHFEPKLNHSNPSPPPQPSSYQHITMEPPSAISVSKQFNIENNNSLSAKEKKPSSSKLAYYFKKPNSKTPFKSFYKKVKKNIKAMTFKILHF